MDFTMTDMIYLLNQRNMHSKYFLSKYGSSSTVHPKSLKRKCIEMDASEELKTLMSCSNSKIIRQ